MDAIVLVGGQGTRLRPLTARRHKSLVPVCNRPAIQYLFEWLAGSGIERAVLAIGQDNGDLASAYPVGVHAGIRVAHVLERERLESGGAIRNAVEVAGVAGRFVVVNGDIFTDMDLPAALRAHEKREADLTLALTPVEDPSRFGVAVVDEDGLVVGFVEKPPRGTEPGRLVNAGVWIFEPELVGEIPPGAVRVEETLFPSLVARRRRVLGHVFEGTWGEFGTPESYLHLNEQLLAGGTRTPNRDGVRGCHLAEDAEVAASADVEGSVLGPGCAVEEGAEVTRSVLWERVRVGRGAQVEGSVLAEGVAIGAGAKVSGLMAGAGAVVEEGAVVSGGTSLEPGERYHGQDGE